MTLSVMLLERRRWGFCFYVHFGHSGVRVTTVMDEPALPLEYDRLFDTPGYQISIDTKPTLSISDLGISHVESSRNYIQVHYFLGVSQGARSIFRFETLMEHHALWRCSEGWVKFPAS